MRQRLLRRVDYPAFPIASTTTSIGSTTALNDSVLAAAAQREDYEQAWIYISELVASGPAIGEIARVSNVDFAGSTSQLILVPAMTNAIQTGTDYEIHRKFHPSILNQVLDDVLDELEHPLIIPLSLIADGDMETSGVGSWDDDLSNATIAKDTTNVLHGRQSLAVTATGANGQARSQAVNLPPSTECIVAADVFITAGDSARLIFYDVTNSANIDTAVSAATGWVHFEFRATTPSTCEQVSLRLEAQANNDVIYFDNAILLPTKQVSLPYPSSLEFADELMELMYFPLGTGLSATTDDNAYKLLEKPATFWSHGTRERDETAVVPYRVQVNKSPLLRPLWIEGRIDFPAFAGSTAALLDADTTLAPKELVIELAYARLLDILANEARDEGDTNKMTILTAQALDVRDKMDGLFRNYIVNKGVVIGAKR